jgi:hypothetical protein
VQDDRQQRLRALQAIHEMPFRSQLPVLGSVIVRLRTLWNDVATRWYVRPLVEQQNTFNQAVVDALAAQEAALQALDVRLQTMEAWLIEQDREKAQLAHDVGDLAAQVAQQRRVLAAQVARLTRGGATLPDNDQMPDGL